MLPRSRNSHLPASLCQHSHGITREESNTVGTKHSETAKQGTVIPKQPKLHEMVHLISDFVFINMGIKIW